MNNPYLVKKRRTRFNFVDVLVLTALLFTALVLIGSALSLDAKNERLTVCFEVSAEDRSTTLGAAEAFEKGTAVYFAGSGELLGHLEKEYQPGSAELFLTLTAQRRGTERAVKDFRLYIGNTADLQCGTLYLEKVAVADWTEVTKDE